MKLKFWILMILTNVTSILIASNNSTPQRQTGSAPADKILIVPSPLKSVLPEAQTLPNEEEERLIQEGKKLCSFYEEAFDPKGKRFLEFNDTELSFGKRYALRKNKGGHHFLH